MPKEDINQKEFDEATITKLEIFEKYFEEWLPVFLNLEYIPSVLICDFFAGSGSDILGVPGSPLRILRTLEKYQDLIIRKNTNVHIVFNEVMPHKLDELHEQVKSSFPHINEKYNGMVSIEYKAEEFESLFYEYEKQFQKQPNLMFIDQYGATEVNDSIFQRLISLNRTDFLFFISSAHIRRFAEQPGFKECFQGLDVENIRSCKYVDIHRMILEYYRRKITPENNTRLYLFSIKKGKNIYGLVFGAKHPKAFEKFLAVVWRKNELNGEADFDIDGDREKMIPDLFPETVPSTKIKLFQKNVEHMLFEKRGINSKDLLDYAFENGHPAFHAVEVVQKLKKDGRVEYQGRLGCSYETCYKKGVIKQIRVVASK